MNTSFTTPLLENEMLLLKPLTSADSEAYYGLYSNSKTIERYDQPPIRLNETPVAFTNRILASCDFIWTIRFQSTPEEIIGDCALHDWDKANGRIEIGGSLSPAYWGMNLMKQAFELIIDFAVQSLKIQLFIGRTSPLNSQAIRLVEKLGFSKEAVVDNDQVLILRIR